MEVFIDAAAGLFEPARFLMLVTGVFLGITIGVIPGLGGIFGLTLLVPLTYSLDPMATFALLLGMASVTTTSDTIPAILLGIPGTVGSAATVVDGHELAKQGQASRALGAAYTSSLIGGLFGALVLTAALPIMRPLVLLLNYGDLLAITLFGLALVAVLSSGDLLRGLLAAIVGILVSFIGLDPFDGEPRGTFGMLYFWDGVPTAVLFLGLFGLSELSGILRRGSIERAAISGRRDFFRQGVVDTMRNWRTVLKCSAIGSFLGAVPGVGVTVIEWIAYGITARQKTDGPPFGSGNIAGVIGPESANNAKEGGALVPTLAFGIPGSATMAILLGAFAIHGLVPGPRMLEQDAPLLVSMIMTVAIANILATGICLCMTPQLARIARVPAFLLVPAALSFIALGAFSTNRDATDLVLLVIFGAIGIAFKATGWSRPAFALGFVLGPNLERFFFLTYQISGWEWLSQPSVLIVLALSVLVFGREIRRYKVAAPRESGVVRIDLGLTIIAASGIFAVIIFSQSASFAAKLFPLAVSVPGFILAVIILVQRMGEMRRTAPLVSSEWAGGSGIYLIALATVNSLFLLAFGHLVGTCLFMIGAMAALGNRDLKTIAIALPCTGIVVYGVFNFLSTRSWPAPWVLEVLNI